MQLHSFVPIITFELACLITPVSAQNLPNWTNIPEDHPFTGKVEASPADARLLYRMQKTKALDSHEITIQETSTAIDADALGHFSIYRETIKTGVNHRFDDSQERLGHCLALLSATYRKPGTSAEKEGCVGVALSIGQRIEIEPDAILETVATEVAANPACVCEIVKSSIQAAPADPSLVVSIVETSIIAAPEQMRMISQCAIAAAPESLAAIQELLTKLDPNSGEPGSRSKSGKSGKSTKSWINIIDDISDGQKTPNPLDRLWISAVPPQLIVPPVTEVDPRTVSR